MENTLRLEAYNAIERAMMSEDPEIEVKGTEAFHRFKDKSMPEDEIKKWAYNEKEYRSLNELP